MKKIILYFLSVFCILVITCKSNSIPKKPDLVPNEANWLGGADGGVWVYIKKKLNTEQYLINIYTDAGNLWVEDTFRIEDKCLPMLSDTINIFDLMSSFDGKDIILKIKSPDDEYFCRLRDINKE